MLSKRIIKQIGFRFRLLKLCGATHFDWDPEKCQIIRANTYIFFTMIFGIICAHFYPLALMIQIYLKLHPFEENGKYTDPYFFAKLVITWAELVIGVMLTFMNITISKRQDDIIFLFNQLVLYSTQLQGNEITIY